MRVFLLLLLLLPIKIWGLQNICGNVYINSNEKFKFSKNDEVFICGDDASQVWKNIPLNQKKYHISAVLQKSGYYAPTYSWEETDQRLIIHPGELTEVERVVFNNAPKPFTESVRRKPYEGRLTADKLKELQSWTTSHLQAVGYACPEVSARANSTTGEIFIDMEPGRRMNIMEVERPNDPYNGIYRRFDAFEVGALFNQDLLNLTAQRIVLADLAQYSHFEVECKEDGAYLKQRAALGKPRLLTFSIGSSTEEAVITKLQWKHARLGEQASTLKAEVSYTPRKQQFITNAQFYLFPDWVYTFFLPEVSVTRESEKSYETVQRKFGALLGHTEDNHEFRYYLKGGPYYNHLSTLAGVGPRRSQYISWEGNARIVSHYYEYYQASPREGYYLDLGYISQRKGIGSDLNADQLALTGSQLFNFKLYDPPLHVLGVRFSLRTTIVEEKQFELLPQDYRLTLGGDDNIRGFGRKAINNNGAGYITTAYLGLEWRFLQVLPYKIQPFVLLDAAQVGDETFALQSTLLWSPGLGLRWQSPIGAFRVTAARGRIEDAKGATRDLKADWVYFLSYGNEF